MSDLRRVVAEGFHGDLGGLAELDRDHVDLADLDLGEQAGHVADDHDHGAWKIGRSRHDGLALLRVELDHDAVHGRADGGAGEIVGGAFERRPVLVDRVVLSVDLHRGGVDRQLRPIELLLTDQIVVEETLHPAQVSLGVGELDLQTADRDLGLAQRGLGLIARALVEVAFDLDQQLAGPDVLAFHHGQRGDLTDDLRRDLDLLLRGDLAGCLDPGRDRSSLCGLNLDLDAARLRVPEAGPDDQGENRGDRDADQCFLHLRPPRVRRTCPEARPAPPWQRARRPMAPARRWRPGPWSAVR